jgi:hypothetical protein
MYVRYQDKTRTVLSVSLPVGESNVPSGNAREITRLSARITSGKAELNITRKGRRSAKPADTGQQRIDPGMGCILWEADDIEVRLSYAITFSFFKDCQFLFSCESISAHFDLPILNLKLVESFSSYLGG